MQLKRLSPRLSPPEPDQWATAYPQGLGASAFSSPAFQRLIVREHGPDWRSAFLYSESPAGERLSLPVGVRRSNWGHAEITALPVAYYGVPVEVGALSLAATAAIVDATQAVLPTTFSWWLPPWFDVDPVHLAAHQWYGDVTCSPLDTYVMRLTGSADAYLGQHVSARQQKRLRATYRRGLEMTSTPSSNLVDEYYALYSRVYDQRNWTGPQFSRQFFHGVASELEQGGELLIMSHGGRVVAGGVLLHDRHAVHCFQCTVDREVHGVWPHSLLYAMALERAEARQVGIVNLGGVNIGNDGLVRFKRSWGAQPEQAVLLRSQTGRRVLQAKVNAYLGTLIRGRATRDRHAVAREELSRNG